MAESLSLVTYCSEFKLFAIRQTPLVVASAIISKQVFEAASTNVCLELDGVSHLAQEK